MSLSDPADLSRFNLVNWLLLLAVALAGIAHVAFLPPFEGFDETNHFSYIQQIADTGTIPRFGVDKASADIDSYPGPRPYSAAPPYDRVGGLTYRSFFNGSSIAEPDPRRRARLSAGPPGQCGGPASAPLLPADGAVLPARQELELAQRCSCCCGSFPGGWPSPASSSAAVPPSRACWLSRFHPGSACWPPPGRSCSPSSFPKWRGSAMTASACCCMGIGWWLMLRLLVDRKVATTLALGLVLGLGLLTKAFFVPTLAGCVALLCFHELRERDGRQIRNAVILLASACLIGGGWYRLSLSDRRQLHRLQRHHRRTAAGTSPGADPEQRGSARRPARHRRIGGQLCLGRHLVLWPLLADLHPAGDPAGGRTAVQLADPATLGADAGDRTSLRRQPHGAGPALLHADPDRARARCAPARPAGICTSWRARWPWL